MIPERLKKGNIPPTLLLILLVVLVGVASFGLGRLSATQKGQGSVIIHEPADAGQQ